LSVISFVEDVGKSILKQEMVTITTNTSAMENLPKYSIHHSHVERFLAGAGTYLITRANKRGWLKEMGREKLGNFVGEHCYHNRWTAASLTCGHIPEKMRRKKYSKYGETGEKVNPSASGSLM